MADLDSLKESNNYHLDIPARNQPFFLKGCGALDWGMQNRLARVFRPDSGRTVMLAVDHGYFQGSISGRSPGAVCRCSHAHPGHASQHHPGRLRARRRDAGQRRPQRAQGAVQRATGRGYGRRDPHERGCHGRAGIRGRGVRNPVHPQHDPPGRCWLPLRHPAELGANFVKTYYVDDFETITASCPVPIVMAGGKKLPELDALAMAYNAIDQGAAGVDMGRNIFQSDAPEAMIQAVGRVVHELMKPQDAYDLFLTLKNEKKQARVP